MLSAASGVGGSERVAFQIARGVMARGHSVRGLVRAPVADAGLLDWYRDATIPVEASPSLKALSLVRLLPSMRALARQVRGWAPAVANLHNPGNTILFTDVLALRRAGVRRVIASAHHPIDPATLPRSWRLSTRLAARRADAVVVTSPVLEETMLQMGVPAAKLVTIPLGVSVPVDPPCREAARKSLGLAPDSFLVGSMARLEPFKRIDELVRACAASSAFMKRGYLVVAGDGPERARLETEAQARLPGRFRFLGTITETETFYAALDLFALPSELEGFGLVYAEAAMLGVPSIGCDAGGTRYAIQDRETGVLLPKAELGRLSTELEALMNTPDELRRLGENARLRAYDQFDEAKMIAAYAKLLEL
ncbi:MAG: glycosyltransferase family 4 protein [Proteobacteria bacterium]|nr:glycosyltransferase family 4 protein [Pseudomonadota bacterium]